MIGVGKGIVGGRAGPERVQTTQGLRLDICCRSRVRKKKISGHTDGQSLLWCGVPGQGSSDEIPSTAWFHRRMKKFQQHDIQEEIKLLKFRVDLVSRRENKDIMRSSPGVSLPIMNDVGSL